MRNSATYPHIEPILSNKVGGCCRWEILKEVCFWNKPQTCSNTGTCFWYYSHGLTMQSLYQSNRWWLSTLFVYIIAVVIKVESNSIYHHYINRNDPFTLLQKYMLSYEFPFTLDASFFWSQLCYFPARNQA